jgi:carbonic anhydrase
MRKHTIIAILAACAAVNHAAFAADKAPANAEEALAALRQGNERFQAGLAERRDLLEEAKETSGGQKPFAAVVSCIDSRTSTELIFDQGIGDVFNARLAGNVVDEDVLGSLEFATKVAGAKLVAVIGHSGCGAVVGAIDQVKLGNLTSLLDRIEPAVAEAAKHGKDCTAKNPEFVDACIEENVRLQVKQLTEKSPILKELADQGQIRVVGGVHDLASGKVRFLADAE